jgi:hypothetical protein
MLKISDVEPLTALNGLFTDGKVASGVAPTRLVADWFNAIQTELVNVVEGFDLTLNPDDSTQILQVLKEYSLPLYLLALLFHGLLIPYRQRAVSHLCKGKLLV